MKPALLIATLALAAAGSASAQTPAAKPAAVKPVAPVAAPAVNPCPSNNYSVIRVSRLKPAGTMAGFRKAVADNAKWYTDHGYPADRFTFATLVNRDAAGRTSPAPGLVMTIHASSSTVPAARHDAAWNAFVAEYNANSDIVRTTLACVTP